MINKSNIYEPITLEKFYGLIDTVKVYPGNLDELNQLTLDTYKLISQTGAKLYLEGYIFPSQAELEKGISLIKQSIDYLNEPFSFGKTQEFNILGVRLEESSLENPEETVDNIFSLYHEMGLLNNDIRVKANNIGADGLIHFTLIPGKDIPYCQSVPVKKI